jgi:hypothetical protein
MRCPLLFPRRSHARRKGKEKRRKGKGERKRKGKGDVSQIIKGKKEKGTYLK